MSIYSDSIHDTVWQEQSTLKEHDRTREHKNGRLICALATHIRDNILHVCLLSMYQVHAQAAEPMKTEDCETEVLPKALQMHSLKFPLCRMGLIYSIEACVAQRAKPVHACASHVRTQHISTCICAHARALTHLPRAP